MLLLRRCLLCGAGLAWAGAGLGLGWLARLGPGWLFLGFGFDFGWLSVGFHDFGFGLILA